MWKHKQFWIKRNSEAPLTLFSEAAAGAVL